MAIMLNSATIFSLRLRKGFTPPQGLGYFPAVFMLFSKLLTKEKKKKSQAGSYKVGLKFNFLKCFHQNRTDDSHVQNYISI